MGSGKSAARAVLVMFAMAGAMLAAADRAMAREQATGCKVGPLKTAAELDDRIAACTILIDGAKPAAQTALALSYRAQNLLDQKKCDLAFADLMRAKDLFPSKKSSQYYDLHLWISYYWQNCRAISIAASTC